MKFVFIISTLLCFLQSCTTYYFTSPQPAGGEKLSEIPENLRGTWNCKYDSLGEKKCFDNEGYTIGANQISFKEKNETTIWKLGQEVEILKLTDFYVLNFVQTQKMFNSKGKQVVSPLYSIMVISEVEGAINIWNVDRPWDNKSARKFKKAESISEMIEVDTMSNESNFMLNFSLNQKALEKISLLKPGFMFGSDSTILSGDEIEWGNYECEGQMFENPSDERKYFKWSDKISRLERKQDLLMYQNQYHQIFGDAPKGYALLMTEEFYTDSSEVKHPLNFSENPKKYEVYRLVEYHEDVAPRQQDLLYIDKSKTIPFEIAQEFIQQHKISYLTFKVDGKAVEEGVTTWNHLSEEDKKTLLEVLEYKSMDE